MASPVDLSPPEAVQHQGTQHTSSVINRQIQTDSNFNVILRASYACLFGLAVECANSRLSMWLGLISCTEPGTNPARVRKLGQARMLLINIMGSQ